jgi:hypothetical protein
MDVPIIFITTKGGKKMKKIGIIFCGVLVTVFVFSLAVPAAFAQALGVADTQWFEAKLSKTTGFDASSGRVEKVKVKLQSKFYLKLCDLTGVPAPPPIVDCQGGVLYGGFAVFDLNNDGDYDPADVSGPILQTCGADEGTIYAQDLVIGINTVDFNGELSSKLKLNSKGCIWAGGPGGQLVGKRCKVRAKPVDVADLPFNPADFVGFGGFICPSEVP